MAGLAWWVGGPFDFHPCEPVGLQEPEARFDNITRLCCMIFKVRVCGLLIAGMLVPSSRPLPFLGFPDDDIYMHADANCPGVSG